MADWPSTDHDHGLCVSDALIRAEAICDEQGVRLTDIRRQVLELLWKEHRPRGAYDILNELASQGRKTAPLTVYRALDFLVANGLAHRIESLNAFIGCTQPENYHATQFLVCTRCGATTELTDSGLSAAIRAAADAARFSVTRPVVELQGLCPACQANNVAEIGSE
ncbi:Fur family transcriptional regulator [Fodinicurvata sp. EGI_FJ10296]|jgi:Fur family zinc uptake transcriptional regulator|uniref:Fur family transcriptional regulator n=1 Tax=Fodinicurvata sp. EGI_FJ10296 TaxID=3231908 RepID=UPI003456271E